MQIGQRVKIIDSRYTCCGEFGVILEIYKDLLVVGTSDGENVAIMEIGVEAL